MPARLRTIVFACAIALALAGCGSGEEGTIPSGASDDLVGLLDAIENDISAGECETAQERATQFADEVNTLPPQVDDKVRQGLTEAAGRLIELSNEPGQCDAVTGASGETGVESSTTTSTEESSTTTEESSTSTSTTDSTTPEPDEEQPSGNQGDEPLEIPGEGGGTGGRGSDSGGLEPQKRDRS